MAVTLVACFGDSTPDDSMWRCALNYQCAPDPHTYTIIETEPMSPDEAQSFADDWTHACQQLTAPEVTHRRCELVACYVDCKAER